MKTKINTDNLQRLNHIRNLLKQLDVAIHNSNMELDTLVPQVESVAEYVPDLLKWTEAYIATAAEELFQQ
jgi:hypothetical protein